MTTGAKILIGVGVGGALLIMLNRVRLNPPTVKYVDKVPFKQNAITIPPFGIYIHKDQQQNSALLSHELIHWQQYQRMGLLPYYYNYLKEHLKNGYDGNLMEQEARVNESNFCKTNYTQCVRTGLAVTVHNTNFRA